MFASKGTMLAVRYASSAAARKGPSVCLLPGALRAQDAKGKRHTVALVPGDGVGGDLVTSVQAVLRAASAPIDFEQVDLKPKYSNKTIPHKEKVAEIAGAVKRHGIGLKGLFFTEPGTKSVNVGIRKHLDLYTSVAAVQGFLKESTRHADMILVRENTEGEYSGLEHEPWPGVVESLKVVTQTKSSRIARFAYLVANMNTRKKVTAIHKANIMKLTDGLFLQTCKQTHEEYNKNKKQGEVDIAFEDMIVDNAAMQMVSKPAQFDVVVLGNLYGSILSNIGAGLVGGPGVVPGVNLHYDFDTKKTVCAVFEPGCRHVGRDLEARNLANPSALVLSAAMMLEYLGHPDHAGRVQRAVVSTINSGIRTQDLPGGTHSCTDFTAAVVKSIEADKN